MSDMSGSTVMAWLVIAGCVLVSRLSVSMPLLTRTFPDQLPFRVFNVTVAELPKRDIPAADTVSAAVPASTPIPASTVMRH